MQIDPVAFGNEIAMLVRDCVAPIQEQAALAVSKAEQLAAEVLVLREQLAAVPAPLNGKDADPLVIKAMVQDAVDAIPRPQDGKSVDLAVLIGEINHAAAKAVETLPVPKDGRDFDPELLEAAVQKAVSAIEVPKAEPGRDADPLVVQAMVMAEVSRAVAEMPKPVDGKSVDAAELAGEVVKAAQLMVKSLVSEEFDVKQEIRTEVQRAVADLQPLVVERAVDVGVVRGILSAELGRAVAELPIPKDGKSVELAEVADLVAKAVSALPAPKAITPDDLLPMVAEQVKDAVLAIPVPKDGVDGTSVKPEDVMAMVVKAVADLPAPQVIERAVDADVLRDAVSVEVQKAVESIPAPKDGKDADPDMIAKAVDAAVKLLPAPKDGQDGYTPSQEDIGAVLEDLLIERNFATKADIPQIPKLPDDETIAAMVSKAAEQAVASLPKPRDGETPSVETVRALMAGEVAQWAVEYERRAADAIRAEVDRLPKPKDGRDALDLPLLPGIDQAKSYAPGVWAKHAGGIWKSARDTNGMDGWDCIVQGIQSVEVKADDDMRTLQLSVVNSAGKSADMAVTLPVAIYRGIFREDQTYTKGDQVTRGGSTWALMNDKPIGKPGDDNSGWQLSVKRGTDGKNGIAGAPGRPGKDLTKR